MLSINEKMDGNTLTVTLDGKITSTTAPDLTAVLEGKLESLDKLIFDFSGLEYITSAGIRIILNALQTLEEHDAEMVLKNVNDDIMDVFNMTGFLEVLTIE
jgi:anti-anti-sigma factor